MEFKSVLPPSTTRSPPRVKSPKYINIVNTLRSNFDLSTWILIGATFQTLLVLVLPPRYALTPAIILLLIRLTNTMLITYGLKPNPYLKDVILGKTSAQLMDRDGNFAGPGQAKVAVLLLGAKCNHPLGIFAPNFGTMGGYLGRMSKELEGDSTQDNGFLGQTNFTRQDERGANESIFISYWRSLDDVHRYAHGPTHREAWRWWEKTLKENDHIGIMHEVFEAPQGQWESLYGNFQPTMLGATTYLKRDGKLEGGNVGEQWVSPLLDANKGPLRSSLGRRGFNNSGKALDMFVENVYA